MIGEFGSNGESANFDFDQEGSEASITVLSSQHTHVRSEKGPQMPSNAKPTVKKIRKVP